MNIYAKRGDKVVYTEASAKNGYDYQKERCKELLEIGKTYTVDRTEVHSCHTNVWVQEFPYETFNSVNFEDADQYPRCPSFTNDLSPSEAERLAILLEELGEAQQAVGKILRHGYESVNPLDMDSDTNRHNLEKEVGDVFYAVDLMSKSGDLNKTKIGLRVVEKSKRIRPYLHHQKVF